uniref:Uncharacterized protein n=1 Tax=Ackermannviridae sp. TaxID=2831612 RepID=A0A8S5VIY7_9CAUD|nr:MAG TPA: hypothetical protein [Ackermannviridae sp.]
MTNPILQAMGKSAMPNNPMAMMQQFMQFKQQMQGQDPQKIVEQMLADGRMSQQQFEQLKQQAEQFKGIFY